MRVALIDSGVDAEHPHIAPLGTVVHRASVDPEGHLCAGDAPDRLGHGTAVAAAILSLAPGTELLSFQVFQDRLACPFAHVVTALEAALEQAPQIINLSLGTISEDWRAPLTDLASLAVERGTRLVAPASFRGLPSLPGSLSAVDGVLVDEGCPREAARFDEATRTWMASPYPREIPGVPKDRNLSGVSFAVANVTGGLAREG